MKGAGMIQRGNFWWLMQAWEINPPAKKFIESLTAAQMHKLDDVLRAVPNYRLITEIMGGTEAIEEVMCRKGLTREDICQIEAEAFGIFAGALLKAFKRGADGD